MSSSGSGTVINYGSRSGSDFLMSYGSGSGSTRQNVTVPVPQHCMAHGPIGSRRYDKVSGSPRNTIILELIFKLNPLVNSMVIRSNSRSYESIATVPDKYQLFRSNTLWQQHLRSTGIFAVRWAKQARQRKRDHREPHSPYWGGRG